MRVVSLLPAATEILHRLDAIDLLVARSHECDHPDGDSADARSLADLPILTAQRTRFTSAAEVDRLVTEALSAGESLYTLDEDGLRRARPDLILTQDLCEVCSVDLASVRRAADSLDPPPRVLSLNPTTIDAVIDDITRVGQAIGRADDARRVVVDLTTRLDLAASAVPAFAPGARVLFLEWPDPPFSPGHWTPQLIEWAGGEHPLNPTAPTGVPDGVTGPLNAERTAGKGERVSFDRILAVDADTPFDRVILCPCGLSLDETRHEAARIFGEKGPLGALRAVTQEREAPAHDSLGSRVALIDGNQMFSRPGPRLVDAFEWLVAWLHGRPEFAPPSFPAAPLASAVVA